MGMTNGVYEPEEENRNGILINTMVTHGTQ